MARKTSKPAANTAVLYCRVSTEEQAEGVSLAAQEAALRAYCTMRNLQIVDVVIDAGVSAGKALDRRAGGARILSAAAGDACHVVAWKLDRLFRDAADCLNVTAAWDKAGVALHLVDMGGQAVDTATAMGRFFLTMLAGVAEMERNLIRERTAAAMAHKKSRREYCGGEAPYGWQVAADGRTLEANPAEQKVIRIARELKESGLSLRKVAARLAERGMLPRSGRSWHAQSVKGLVNSEVA